MSTTSTKRQMVFHNLAEAKAYITAHVPSYHLDFVCSYAGTACWHIVPAGTMELAGSVYEDEYGMVTVALKPAYLR